MSKSKIMMAMVAGVALGAIVVYAVKTSGEISKNELANNDDAPSKLDNIAKQFSDKISTELKAAEKKIRSAVTKEIDGLSPEREMGLFL